MSFTFAFFFLFSLPLFAASKKGGKIQVDVSDVVNPDPDALTQQPTGEDNPGLLQGDIIAEGKNAEDRNAIKSTSGKLWPKGTVPYIMDYTINKLPDMKKKILASIDDFNKNTCIRFVQRIREKDYVLINARKAGCSAKVGRQGGQQPLILHPDACFLKGSIIHEMLHTIGFNHEQNRADRDKYVKIHWDNINKDKHIQFKKLAPYEEDNMGFSYDFSSVLHYGPLGFSNNGYETITTVDSRNQRKIGQRAGFSKQDIEEVNKLYKCSGSTSSVGGTNGCTDKVDNCAEIAGNCKGYTIKTMCKATCKRC